MQCPGKEQVAEHALHQRLVEVDRADERFRADEHPGVDLPDRQQRDRVQKGQQHQAHGRGQLQYFVVDQREQCCEPNEDAGDIKETHG